MILKFDVQFYKYTAADVYCCKNCVLPQILSSVHKFSLQGSGWKVVASFEGNFPNRIKQLPLDRHFDINNVKRVESLFLISFFFCSVFDL